jgi:TPR repeat protein
MGLFGRRASAFDRALDAFEHRQWKRARGLLEQALASEEHTLGQYHLGLLYWRGLGGKRDVAAAVAQFERAAASAHAGAQTAYGIALRSGIGATKDDEKARALFLSAAAAGDCNAMVQLATMSEPQAARRTMLRAAELGHAPAMLHLSDMLIRDDPVESLSWLYAAVARSGDDAARKRAARLAHEMSAAEIDAAQKAGRAYAKNIAQRTMGL